MTGDPWMAALTARANEHRARRTELRRALNSTHTGGLLQAAELLDGDIPEWARTMTVGRLVTSIRLVGPGTLQKILRHALIWNERRLLAHLTRRERDALAAELRSIAAGDWKRR